MFESGEITQHKVVVTANYFECMPFKVSEMLPIKTVNTNSLKYFNLFHCSDI